MIESGKNVLIIHYVVIDSLIISRLLVQDIGIVQYDKIIIFASTCNAQLIEADDLWLEMHGFRIRILKSDESDAFFGVPKSDVFKHQIRSWIGVE